MQVQPRQFYQDCDYIFKQIRSVGNRADVTNEMLQGIKSPIKQVISYLERRGHIKTWGTYNLQISEPGKLFFMQTSYTEEYDKEYEKEHSERLDIQDKPYKILREKRTYFLAAIGVLLTIIGIVIGIAIAKGKC